MKYLLLVYLDETWEKRSLAERQELYWGQVRTTEELVARGQYLGGNPLHPTSTATSVRVREHLGGYMLIDVENLDDAIAFAARGPLARVGTIEVRPVREGPPA